MTRFMHHMHFDAYVMAGCLPHLNPKDDYKFKQGNKQIFLSNTGDHSYGTKPCITYIPQHICITPLGTTCMTSYVRASPTVPKHIVRHKDISGSGINAC